VVGTGSAVSPFNFCLSPQGNRQDRSDYRATLDGLSFSTSGQADDPDAPTGVSGHRGFRSASHLGKVRDASDYRVGTEISGYLGDRPLRPFIGLIILPLIRKLHPRCRRNFRSRCPLESHLERTKRLRKVQADA
jgi:hypothetical protein